MTDPGGLSHRLATTDDLPELRALMALSIRALIGAYLEDHTYFAVECEGEAAAAREGFRSLELVATVAGEPLYSACGFTVLERIAVPTSTVTVPCARMRKPIAADCGGS